MKSDTQHWAAAEEVGVLWGLKAMVAVYRWFGRTVFRAVLYPVVAFYFLVNGTARKASRDYLRRLGEYWPETRLTGSLSESYRHFVAFAETILEKIVVWLDRLDPDTIEFHNRQMLLDQMARGQGGILLSGHIGNLEICRALADLRGTIRLNIFVHTKHAEKFNRLLNSVDRGSTIELIQVTELNPALAVRLHHKVETGEFVVIVGDRVPITSEGRTVKARFLGQEAEFPQGPYLLASLLKCPVFTFFCYPRGNRHHIYLDRFANRIMLSRDDSARRRELTDYAGRFAESLQNHCRQVPFQWFNFYPFWKL